MAKTYSLQQGATIIDIRPCLSTESKVRHMGLNWEIYPDHDLEIRVLRIHNDHTGHYAEFWVSSYLGRGMTTENAAQEKADDIATLWALAEMDWHKVEELNN